MVDRPRGFWTIMGHIGSLGIAALVQSEELKDIIVERGEIDRLIYRFKENIPVFTYDQTLSISYNGSPVDTLKNMRRALLTKDAPVDQLIQDLSLIHI